MPTTVLIVDDHELIRRGLTDLLAETDDIVAIGDAATAGGAVGLVKLRQPDVMIIDVRLPDGDGIELCREIRSIYPEVRCLIFTADDSEAAVLGAIMAGAAGFVLKQVRGWELIDDIRRIAQGQSLLDPAVTGRVLERIRRPQAEPTGAELLTDRERDVLALIAEGLTNRGIAEKLFLTEKTVKNYVSNVLAKLGLQSRTQAALFVSRHPA